MKGRRFVHVIRTIAEARKIRKSEKGVVGFVPTMGALHQGHLSLVQAAKTKSDSVWASIFVNPAQFAPHEDFNKYPRNLEADVSLLEKHGVNYVFSPQSEKELYPTIAGQGVKAQQTFVVPLAVEEFDQAESKARPGHFRGVATVVTKLFNIVRPDFAFFGQKDGLQSMVISQLVRDLNFETRVEICATVREEDGLAMSSRNVYLTVEERRIAPVLFRALSAVKKAFDQQGLRNRHQLELEAFKVFQSNPAWMGKFTVEYLSFVDFDTALEVKDTLPSHVMVSCAINFGKCRILDNVRCHDQTSA